MSNLIDGAIATWLAEQLIDKMKLLKDSEREMIIGEISANFCMHCGAKLLPCHCMNDE